MSGLVVCFIPCCDKKEDTGLITDLPYIWPLNNEIGSRLRSTRESLKDSIEYDYNIEASAFKLYKGRIYIKHLKREVEEIIRAGRLRLFIISAGYGIVDAFELIYKYNAEMKNEIARQWDMLGLTDIISDLCISLNPEQIYGFFTGESKWDNKNKNNYKPIYRYFFTTGVQKAIKSIPSLQRAGCFFGSGTAALNALGWCFYEFANSDFAESFLDSRVKIQDGYRRRDIDGKARIGYEEFEL